MKHTFEVYFEGSSKNQKIVAASAKEAAELFYESHIITEGLSSYEFNDSERVVVEHPEGPKIDPSAKWDSDEDGVFTLFNVSVTSIIVDAQEV